MAIINHLVILISGIILVVADSSLDTVLDPMCQAKCLKHFKELMTNSVNSSEILRNPYLIKSFCSQHSSCKGCLLGCSKSAQSLESCMNYCKTTSYTQQESCMVSCELINELKMNRPGVCPKVKRKSQCSFHCDTDSQCFKQGTKCCKSQVCNSTCQLIEYPTEGVPPIPKSPLARQIVNEKNPDQIQFDLDWSGYNISLIEYPVLFAVQVRIGHLNELKNPVFDRWRTIVYTSKFGVIISSIALDMYYQFRLLAFSESGLKGVGEMTLPITSNYKPINPATPKNVSEKVTRIINGKISVTLTWQPGDSNSLLPLSSYKISWKRVYELNENNPLVIEYEISIPAVETQYTIENLLPSASYMVKIISVVVYKDEKYNSSSAVYYISTASIPQQKKFSESVILNGNNYNSECACGFSNMEVPVEINNATIVKGQLAMQIKLKHNHFGPYAFRIQWQPMACIESQYNNQIHPVFDKLQTIITKNYIDHYLTGLRYHCNYHLEIELFSEIVRKMKIWEGCFCTPNCNDHMLSTNEVQPLCPSSDQHIPQPIHQLRVVIRKSTNKSNTDAELFWSSEPRTPVTSFRITWGPRLEEPIDETIYGKDFMPLLDSGKALSKVVNYPVHKSVLKDLLVGKIYIVKLQAIDNYSTSRESSIFFKVHSDKNSSSKERCLNYLLLLLSLFISLHNI